MTRSAARGSQARMAIALAWLILVTMAHPMASAAEPSDVSGRTVTVDSERFELGRLTQATAGKPTQRERANATVIGARVARRPGPSADVAGAVEPARAPQAVTEDFSAFTLDPVTARQEPVSGTTGVVGTTALSSTNDRVYMASLSSYQGVHNWSAPTFFRLPGGEYYYPPVVAASLYRSRFVAVMSSYQGPSACGTGYLNVAVSATADPLGSWYRYRIPMPDSFADDVRIGVSDDKVVLTTNQWDLDGTKGDCAGDPYEGSRIRVVDWVDLLDGATVTVRDVTPAPATAYYAWQPASNVPRTTTTAAGSALRLVGDHFAGEWGHLAYAYVTGSAKAGTAALGGLTDLTVTRSVRPLLGPPATIAAFPSGNGVQDEQVVSAVAQAGRLWLSANDTCRLEPDTVFRACARFITLDTTVAPPVVVSDGMFVDVEADTFHPEVGVSRDGTSYYAMARSSAIAHAPIDHYVAYRAPGAGIAGPDEAPIWRATQPYALTRWAGMGSLVADPADHRTAWLLYPATDVDAWDGGALLTRLKGGLTADPGGTVAFWPNADWVGSFWVGVSFRPDPSSPIRWLRYSASPEVESTPMGPRLVHGRDAVSGPMLGGVPMGAPDLGGPSSGSTVTVYAQWQTGDGTWSAPVSRTATLDDVPPTVSPLSLSFAPGTVGSSVPVNYAWSITETGSGMYRSKMSQVRKGTGPDQYLVLTFGPTVRSTTRSLLFDHRYQQQLSALDLVWNIGSTPEVIVSPRAAQNASPGLSYSGTWSSQSSSSFLGGSTRYATRAGARVTYTFTGRAIGLVSTRGPDRGKAEIWVDGVKAATIDLRASSRKYRQIVWQKSWATSGSHTVQVRVLGTSGRPRVDADAFVRF